MTKFVVDAGVVLHLASEELEVSGAHKLLAPTLLRSQTLSALHEAVQRGEIPADVARDRLTRIGRMPIRLLGDACSGVGPGTWRISQAAPRPTTPSTSHSLNCRWVMLARGSRGAACRGRGPFHFWHWGGRICALSGGASQFYPPS
jgi:hypothetical protein